MSKYVKILILLLVGLCFVGCPLKKSDEPKLKNIFFRQGYISPDFSPDITEYTLYFDKEHSLVTLNCEAKNGVIDGGENKNIDVFSGRVIEIDVVSNDGEKEKKYFIKCINRNEKLFNKFILSDGTKEYLGVLAVNEIVVDIPEDVDKSKLVAKFDVNEGIKVSVNGLEQKSGECYNDFSKDVVYKLSSMYGKDSEYSIKILKHITDCSNYIKNRENQKIEWLSGNLKVGELYSTYCMANNKQTGNSGIEYYVLENKGINKIEYKNLVSVQEDKQIYFRVNYDYYSWQNNDKFGINKVSEEQIKLDEEKCITDRNENTFKIELEGDTLYNINFDARSWYYDILIYDSTKKEIFSEKTQESTNSGLKNIYYYNKNPGIYYINVDSTMYEYFNKFNIKISKSDSICEIAEKNSISKEISNCKQYNFKAKVEKNQYYIFESDNGKRSNGYYYFLKDRVYNKTMPYSNGYRFISYDANLFAYEDNEELFISVPTLISDKKINARLEKAQITDIPSDGKKREINLSDKFHSNFFRIKLKGGKGYKISYYDINNYPESYSGNIEISYFKEKDITGQLWSNRDYEKKGYIYIKPDADENYIINTYNSGYGGNISLALSEEGAEKETGGFKIANSWGVGNWENKADGFYYLSYEAAKKLGEVYILEPNEGYLPKAIAIINIDGYKMDNSIKISTGNKSKYVSFNFTQNEYTGTTLRGKISKNNFVVDITELMPIIDNKIELSVENMKGDSNNAKINYFSVELYNDYNNQFIEKSENNKVPIEIADGERGICSVEIDGSKIENLIKKYSNKYRLYDYKSEIKREAVKRDNNVVTVNNQKSYGGTGLLPNNKDEMEMYEKSGEIFKIDSSKVLAKRKVRNTKIDLSESKYFPPIGNQGGEGACVAWSMGYYVMTYYYCRANNIDLSGVVYENGNLSKLSNSIMSPNFIYNIGNGGNDAGMNPMNASRILRDFGVCSWEKMLKRDYTYDYIDISEEAWREALKNKPIKSKYMGYMDIYDESDIEALKELLREGYMISMGIDADNFKELDSNDFISSSFYSRASNHMNTIVGYDDTISGGK